MTRGLRNTRISTMAAGNTLSNALSAEIDEQLQQY